MAGGDALDGGEADTGAGEVMMQALEGREQALRVVGGEARAVVADRHLDLRLGPARGECPGVADQVVESE